MTAITFEAAAVELSSAWMRIGYMLNTLRVGGAERLVLSLAEHMRERGHTVRIFVLRSRAEGEFREDFDVRYLDFDRSLAGRMRGCLRAIAEIRAFRPDIVHSHNFHGNMLARLLRIRFGWLRIVSTFHNEYEGPAHRMMFYRMTDGLADRSVAVCQAVARQFIRLHVVRPERCEVVQNGIDLVAFAPDADRREALRAELGAGDEFVWLTAGRVVPAKDPGNLLHAFRQVHGAAPESKLWIAGDMQSEFAAEMQALAARLGLEEVVRWLGVRYDMAALLDAADGFVLASAWEGLPMALGEAMAMQKPVVATEVGGVRELVDGCGTVVPPQSCGALGQAMLAVAWKPAEERATLGRAGRQRIATEFNMHAKAAEWEYCYASVLRDRSLPHRDRRVLAR